MGAYKNKTSSVDNLISQLTSQTELINSYTSKPSDPSSSKSFALTQHSSPQESEFYNIAPILKLGATYNMIIGERSNGKTYSALKLMLDDYWKTGHQGAYIRRYDVEIRGKEINTLFDGHIQNDYISQLTNGQYDRVRYHAGRFYLATFDPDLNKLVYQDNPFCFVFALNNMEHYKGTSYPNIFTIIFDEFITRQFYLNNEFVLFMNMLSTIIRRRLGVKIFMLANTVNKFCPYFAEMGMRHIEELKQGSIDLYSYGASKLKVAVEYCATPKGKNKESDMYFAFDNPSLQMITGGAWEIDMYPHCPFPFKSSDIIFMFFIKFDLHVLQCEVIQAPYINPEPSTSVTITSSSSSSSSSSPSPLASTPISTFIFIHEKTTPIRYPDSDIIFTDEYDPRPNWFRNLRKPSNNLTRKIATYFRDQRVYYATNDVGEIVRNYLQFCVKSGS